jgi:hypothetical protein
MASEVGSLAQLKMRGSGGGSIFKQHSHSALSSEDG